VTQILTLNAILASAIIGGLLIRDDVLVWMAALTLLAVSLGTIWERKNGMSHDR
jgi:hypothetical protein